MQLKSRRKILATALAMMAGVAALGSVQAAEPGKLLIWINGDKGYKGLAKIGEEFTKKTGIPVIVEHPEDATTQFEQTSKTGKGPDIWIWPHDRIGEWISNDLLTPVTPSRQMRNLNAPIGWEAFTVGGKTWGYPMSVEAVALIYNKDLVPVPPKSFDEVIALDKKLASKGKKAILWDYTNTYFSWPLLAAGGGYAFGHWDSGHYDKTNVGVNNAGAKAGVNTIVQLIEKGVMPKGAGYAEMESGFHSGKIAMMINGPWAWENAAKAKINFGVSVIPTVKGKNAAPFVGVLGAMIPKASPNKAKAIEFVENYMLTIGGLKTINADVPLGAPANRVFFEELKSNPNIAATMESAQHGAPMPNNPEMGIFWSSMKTALENITQGKQKTKEGLDAAAKRILNKSDK